MVLSYSAAKGIIYLQETSANQVDSISDVVDTTETSLAQDIEVNYGNKLNQYITCDGAIKYFEGPTDITFKIGKIAGNLELLSALIGNDSLSGSTYTITKYTSFLPRLGIRLFLNETASQQANLRLTDCLLSIGTIISKRKGITMLNVQGVSEGLDTTNWKV